MTVEVSIASVMFESNVSATIPESGETVGSVGCMTGAAAPRVTPGGRRGGTVLGGGAGRAAGLAAHADRTRPATATSSATTRDRRALLPCMPAILGAVVTGGQACKQ
jgi:hypothetical protein